MADSQQFEVKFLKKEQIAKDAYSFHFERPAEFNFTAGQFIRLILDLPQPDERGSSRFFSIASSPTENTFVMIVTRVIESSFKKTLLDLEKGTRAKIAGPYGNFTLQKQAGITYVFLAGGIGITPVRSIIRFSADTNLTTPIILFSSSRTPQDMIFQSELENIAKQHSWFKLIQTVTRPDESRTPWPGVTGRINKELITKHLKDPHNSFFYISGPPQMVDDLKQEVTSLGVDEDKIRMEKFTGY